MPIVCWPVLLTCIGCPCRGNWPKSMLHFSEMHFQDTYLDGSIENTLNNHLYSSLVSLEQMHFTIMSSYLGFSGSKPLFPLYPVRADSLQPKRNGNEKRGKRMLIDH